ncbi:MAG: hypothetical protein Q8P20_00160 [bacterium]|nr:hypothetical protein [bacterium]
MTPKEKAKELIWEYLPILEGWTDESKTKLAKKCALICADEVIKSNPDSGYYIDTEYILDSQIEYWQEVKIELQKF